MKFILKKNDVELLQQELDANQEYLIGRQEDCNIVLDNEEGISRKHLRLYINPEGKGWILEVLSDHGGLFLQNEAIDQVEIQNAATFTLKNYTLEFIPDESKETVEEEHKPKEKSSYSSTRIEDTGGGTRILENDNCSYSLSITVEGEAPECIELESGESWVVGRDPICDISIEHKYLTRKHFQIMKTGNEFKVKDLGSSNGTYLNEKRMTADQFQALKSEDVISVSNLKITFETRKKDFSRIIQNLPALVEEENENKEVMSQFAVPKVVLEEAPIEDLEIDSSFFSKKRIIMFSFIGALLLGFFGYSFIKGKEKRELNQQKEKQTYERNLTIQNHYTLANRYLSQRKFQFCIDELEKLHKKIQFHKDSKTVLSQCIGALQAQKKLEEIDQQKKQALEVEVKVKKIIGACKEKEETFESLDDLNVCLQEAILIDPSNSSISELQQNLQHKESLKELKKQELENKKKLRAERLALYHKARSINNSRQALRAVRAYKLFITIAKQDPSLQTTYRKAVEEMNKIQTNYKNTLSSLYSNCENLIKSESMKKAYYTCKDILKFEPKNKKAKEWIDQAKETLKQSFKDTYLAGNIQESIGDIESAKTLWKKIIEKDINIGYYYKKAKIKLDKYK